MEDQARCVANLLVDMETGSILHANLTAGCFCGYRSEQLRNMMLTDLFHQTVQEIRSRLNGSDGLQVILLDAKLPMGESRSVRAYASRSVRAYASRSPGKDDALFLSIYELACE